MQKLVRSELLLVFVQILKSQACRWCVILYDMNNQFLQDNYQMIQVKRLSIMLSRISSYILSYPRSWNFSLPNRSKSVRRRSSSIGPRVRRMSSIDDMPNRRTERMSLVDEFNVDDNVFMRPDGYLEALGRNIVVRKSGTIRAYLHADVSKGAFQCLYNTTIIDASLRRLDGKYVVSSFIKCSAHYD